MTTLTDVTGFTVPVTSQDDQLLRWPGVPPMFKFQDPDGNTYTTIEAAI